MDIDDHSSTHRLEAFSDGLIAIAITLLIIEIGVPHVTGDESLSAEIADLWPSYGAYILSFVIIGIYWANHHSFLELFRRTDHTFLMLNVIFLMTIAFLPFPTAVLGEYLTDEAQRADAVTFYSIGLLLPAIAWFLVWLYARWRGFGRGVGPGLRALGNIPVSDIGCPLHGGCRCLIRRALGRPGGLRWLDASLPATAAPARVHGGGRRSLTGTLVDPQSGRR